MTDEALETIFKTHRCPLCGDEELLEGPHGGLSVNIRCGACNAAFNICEPMETIQRIDAMRLSTWHRLYGRRRYEFDFEPEQ